MYKVTLLTKAGSEYLLSEEFDNSIDAVSQAEHILYVNKDMYVGYRITKI